MKRSELIKGLISRMFKLLFDPPKRFQLPDIAALQGVTGLYFIFSKDTLISYPFQKSRLLYIGMSESRNNSIGSRLSGHFSGQSGNLGLANYRKIAPLFFTHINFDMLRAVWRSTIEHLETYFIDDFVRVHGVYPICNNKTGALLPIEVEDVTFAIDWQYFA